MVKYDTDVSTQVRILCWLCAHVIDVQASLAAFLILESYNEWRSLKTGLWIWSDPLAQMDLWCVTFWFVLGLLNIDWPSVNISQPLKGHLKEKMNEANPNDKWEQRVLLFEKWIYVAYCWWGQKQTFKKTQQTQWSWYSVITLSNNFRSTVTYITTVASNFLITVKRQTWTLTKRWAAF